MHKFLKSIGFSNINKTDLKNIIEEVRNHPGIIERAEDSEGNNFVELSLDFFRDGGISLRGSFRDDETFEMEYYYPYFGGSKVTTDEIIDVEKHSEKESYAGLCDDPNLGVTLIFYLQNVSDYLGEIVYNNSVKKPKGAIISGLASDGCIILPVENKNPKMSYFPIKNRNKLMADAKDGDEEALENLAIEEIDMYSVLSNRIEKEDILSIVTTYFMPYGIESDQYSILGNILDLSKEVNRITGEEVYLMQVECNNIVFDICINGADLLGEPDIGRRFKGNVWMQGRLLFE